MSFNDRDPFANAQPVDAYFEEAVQPTETADGLSLKHLKHLTSDDRPFPSLPKGGLYLRRS